MQFQFQVTLHRFWYCMGKAQGKYMIYKYKYKYTYIWYMFAMPWLHTGFDATRKTGKNSIYHLLNKKIKNTISFCLTRYGLRKPLTGCCHPKPRPPTPSVLDDILLFLYRKENAHLRTGQHFQRTNDCEKVKVWVIKRPNILQRWMKWKWSKKT